MGLHSRRVWVSLLALGFSLDQAKELTQETWTRLWAQHGQGRLEALELPGLAIVQARFLALDARRRDRRALGEAGAGGDEDHPSAEARLAAAQTLAEVLRELDTLPDAHRRAFELAQEGRAHADIAQLLGFTPPPCPTADMGNPLPAPGSLSRCAMNTPKSHITQELAGRWTSGLLEAGEAQALEAHVSCCDACARLLEAEARVEMTLLQATQQPRAPHRERSRWRRAVVPLAAAAAAIALAVLVERPELGRASSSDGGVAESPPQAFEVPRFEGPSPHPVLTTPAAL